MGCNFFAAKNRKIRSPRFSRMPNLREFMVAIIAIQKRHIHLEDILPNSLTLSTAPISNINVKNCSLYTVLTATDQKPQKS